MRPAGVPARLLWVVDREAIENGSVPRALRAGVRWLHLRDASITARIWQRHLQAWDAGRRVFGAVVNGGPRWAREAGWGAHLKAAQASLPRAQREAWTLLGRSVHDTGETRGALLDRPDYLVAGPVFPTASKPGHPGIGLDGLARIAAAAEGCPVLAIGGIAARHVAKIEAAGAYGVAIRSGITAARDPASAALEYLTALPIDSG